MENKLRITLLIKMLIGFSVSFFIAYLFELDYSYTAGVIAILNLWYSKRTVFITALTRFGASVIGLLISAGLFYLLGYDLYVLFIVVTVVLLVLYLAKLEFGATIALVLIGQQWAGQTSAHALNAFYILVIGTIPALLLNFYVLPYAQFLSSQKIVIDETIRTIFAHLSKKEVYDFATADKLLSNMRRDITVASENYVQANVIKHVNYLIMREGQIVVLKKIAALLTQTNESVYKDKLLTYLATFTTNIGEENYATPLKEQLNVLLANYRKLSLPKSRDEFEHRALLFAIINELDHFLQLKINYHEQMTA